MQTRIHVDGEALFKIRSRKRIARSKIAQVLGISVNDYLMCEAGSKDLSLEKIRVFSEYMGVDIYLLLKDSVVDTEEVELLSLYHKIHVRNRASLFVVLRAFANIDKDLSRS